MTKHKVTANELRLRSTPNSQTNRNILAVLSNGQLVEKIADSGADWWEVRVHLSGGPAATGFVANRFLEAIPPEVVPISSPNPTRACKRGG